MYSGLTVISGVMLPNFWNIDIAIFTAVQLKTMYLLSWRKENKNFTHTLNKFVNFSLFCLIEKNLTLNDDYFLEIFFFLLKFILKLIFFNRNNTKQTYISHITMNDTFIENDMNNFIMIVQKKNVNIEILCKTINR